MSLSDKEQLANAYPRFFRVRQSFPSHAVPNVAAAVDDAIDKAKLSRLIGPSQRVAIAVGSRGIANLPEIVGRVVDHINRLGAQPFIVPAMGSHGGATADGQTATLHSLGITEAAVNAKIVSSMDTIIVGRAFEMDVHFDRAASDADHIIVINRIKPHTRLTGRYESGLVKMLMIGLGKHRGASMYHQVFAEYDYQLDKIAPEIVSMIVQRMPVTLGIGIVEDGYEQTAIVEAVVPDQFLGREPELLAVARSWMPRLPFDRADLLIIDRIGKEISGTGMDTNVVGRKGHDKIGGPDELPKIKQIYVRGLSESTKGNATGIGIAEYCHRHVVNEIDQRATRINCITGEHVTAAAIPMTLDSDREVFDAVIAQNGRTPVDQMRWLRIADTLRLDTMDCSEIYLDLADQHPDLEVLGSPRPIEFSDNGQWKNDDDPPS